MERKQAASPSDDGVNAATAASLVEMRPGPCWMWDGAAGRVVTDATGMMK
jgi:hypothetical protein